MDTSRIQEIILKVNGNDAEKTIKHIQGVIEKAKKAKEDLANEDTSKWGDKEWKKWQQLNREIERGEKQLKKWGRQKKNNLITENNPDWIDLSADWLS